MALSLDTSRAFRSLDELTKLVQAIVTAPPKESEPDWLEWKREADLADGRWKAIIAKFIAGFANRDPATAMQHAGGCGYLVIGVEPGNVLGVSPVDNADLHAGVSRFVGKGVRWSPQYVQYEGKQVLIVTVEPPANGDPIAAMLKGYQPDRGASVCHEGAVFVRHHGTTKPATQDDYNLLARRFAAGGKQASGIRVEPVGSVTAVPVACGPDMVEAWCQREQTALLGGISQNSKEMFGNRTGKEYGRKVLSYLEESARLLPEKACAEALMGRDPSMHLMLVNETDHNFAAVRVEVAIDGDIWGFVSAEEAEPEMPARPRAWNVGSLRTGFRMPSLSAPRISEMLGPHIDNSRPTHIRFDKDNLRPRERIDLDPLYLVADASLAGMTLTIHWKATSTSADGVSAGEFTVTVSTGIVSPLDE